MKYTKLGKNGPVVSRLGFGGMRFVIKEGRIDRSIAIPLLKKAVELGITYFDSAIFYCGGDSQRVIGEATENIRDKVVLSTKNHLYEAPDDVWWARLEESLKSLRTDYIDCYNMHGMTWEIYNKHVINGSCKLKLMEKAKSLGMISHICCSFHDSPDALVKLAETGTFTAITLQYNILNRSLEQAIHKASELGVGIVVMGPVGGGRLGVRSERMKELTKGEVNSTPEAALRFVLGHPGVNVALSGMSSIEMLEENVDAVVNKEPFTREQIGSIEKEMETVREKMGVNCTTCKYCLPCSSGVDIPGNFSVYNDYKIYGLEEHSKSSYAGLVNSAASCTECGECVPKCPQKIEIPNMLKKVMAELDESYGKIVSSMVVFGVTSEKIKAKIVVKNFRETFIKPSIEVVLENGCECGPDRIDFEEIKPFASAIREVEVVIPDGIGVIQGKIIIRNEGEEEESMIRIPLFIVPKDKPRGHKAVMDKKSFGDKEGVLKTHGYCVSLSHDDEKLYLELDVKSEMHALAKPGEAGGGRMEMYVDFRPAGICEQSQYGFGAEQFFVSFAEPGYGTKSGNTYFMNMKNERTSYGCRITMKFSFNEFMMAEWKKPAIIGLDFMFVVASPEGTELGHPTYGGRQGLWQNPALFTKAYLL